MTTFFKLYVVTIPCYGRQRIYFWKWYKTSKVHCHSFNTLRAAGWKPIKPFPLPRPGQKTEKKLGLHMHKIERKTFQVTYYNKWCESRSIGSSSRVIVRVRVVLKKMLFLTYVSTSWAEVIFRVKGIEYMSVSDVVSLVRGNWLVGKVMIVLPVRIV